MPVNENILYWIFIILSLTIRPFQIYFHKNLLQFFTAGPISDSAAYFYLLTYLNKKNPKDKHDHRNLLTPKGQNRQSLYVYLFSKIFSANFIFKYSWFPNYFIQLVFIVLISILINIYFTGYQSMWLLCIFFFYFLPPNLIVNDNNINFLGFSPRFTVLILNSLYWFIVLYCLQNNHQLFPYVFFVLIPLGISSLYISVFSRQSFLFSNLLFFIASGNLEILYILLSSFFYYLFYGFPLQINNFKSDLKHYQKQIIRLNPEELNTRIFPLKYLYFPTLKFSIPYLLLFLIAFFLSIYLGHKTIFLFLICLFFIFFITSTTFLSFLGEGWRYIAINVPFITSYMMAEATLLLIPQKFIYLLISFLLIASISIFFIINKSTFHNPLINLEGLIKKHEGKLKNAHILGQPYWNGIFSLNLGYGKATTMIDFRENILQYIPNYPYFEISKEMIFKYKISHILLSNNLKKNSDEKQIFSEDLVDYLDSNNEFTLYEVKSAIY